MFGLWQRHPEERVPLRPLATALGLALAEAAA
jgi:hypothetical protein